MHPPSQKQQKPNNSSVEARRKKALMNLLNIC